MSFTFRLLREGIGPKVLLLGDSNFSGKIKFGTEQGTLGAALPGSSEWCPKVVSLPDPKKVGTATHIIIATGLNDMVQQDTPEQVLNNLITFIKETRRAWPGNKIYLPGVLPTKNPALNVKIKRYNEMLAGYSVSVREVFYINNNIFQDKQGLLDNRFWLPQVEDSYHLSPEGIKLYASRMKFALKRANNIPFPTRQQRSPPPNTNNRYTYTANSRSSYNNRQQSHRRNN